MKSIQKRVRQPLLGLLAIAFLTNCAEEASLQDQQISDSELATSGHWFKVKGKDTWLKKTTAQSEDLDRGSTMCTLYAGELYKIQEAPKREGEHFLVNLRKMMPGCPFSKGYVFIDHLVDHSGNQPAVASQTESGRFFIWPVRGGITSYYGWRKLSWESAGRMHWGLDIGASSGTPIRAAAYGTIASRFWDSGCGKTVTMTHANAWKTRYCHMSSYSAASQGKYYGQGTVIGYVGETGNVSGAHLHLETYRNGEILNPLNAISGRPG